MKIITFANQKGGVGKTACAVNMASILKRKFKKRVLFIDMDPQCDSTGIYGAQIDGAYTMHDILMYNDPEDINEAIQKLDYGDIIPGDPLLYEAERELLKIDKEEAFVKLRDALASIKNYDYIIIDTNPGLNVLLNNALTATDSVIIPMECDVSSANGIGLFLRTIDDIKNSTNENIKVDGILMTQYRSRSNFDNDAVEYMGKTGKKLNIKVFKTNIRYCSAYKESKSIRKPLIEYRKKSTSEEDYEAFVDEWKKIK